MIALCLATRNAHKTREFVEMLGSDFALEDLSRHPQIGEVVEDGANFAENAQRKALAISRQLPGLVLADDSGLEVDSLGGAPGVFSARYAGPGATDAANRRKLLRAMSGFPPETSRGARFRCVLALARESEVLTIFDGVVEGEITATERGGAGFGYDSIFQPNGRSETFAQLAAAEKNALSHRAKAVAQLRDFLKTTR
jgi:XTP/dITP diphosphohydrolase